MGCNGMASPFFPPNFLLQMAQIPHEDVDGHPPSSFSALLPGGAAASCPSPQQGFHGVAAAVLLGSRPGASFPAAGAADHQQADGELEAGGGAEDDLSDEYCSQVGEKKRRLSTEQVRTLERNFELGNKLEPERKMQLARALGLQPRQVAIWFQNRRARWKTKQLEKDYDVLKRQFEAAKDENDALHAQNKKLQSEVVALKGSREEAEPINLNNKDMTEGSCSNRSDNSSADINLDMSRTSAIDGPLNMSNIITSNHCSSRTPPFFQSISRPVAAAAAMAHLLQSANHPPSARILSEQIQYCPKVEAQGAAPVHHDHENFCNMFCSLDDQTGFWTSWSEQHHFH